MIKITSERLSEVWNLPGCNWGTKNSQGGFCAAGKLDLLGVNIFGEGWASRVFNMNNQGIESGSRSDYNLPPSYFQNPSKLNRSYDSSNPLEWDKHIRALKLGLELAQQQGMIEIEDDAAREFGLIQQSAEVKEDKHCLATSQ
jgi:hypothetical protein